MPNPLRQTKFLVSETSYDRLPEAEAEVAFFGRSNAGKSSAICAICDNKKLARVSKTPGRTREINAFAVTPTKWLVDLPGLGYAQTKARQKEYWPEMIAAYLVRRSSLTRVYFLANAEIGLQPIDLDLIGRIRAQNLPLSLICAKTDKLSRSRHQSQREKMTAQAGFSPQDVFWISSKNKYGLDPLRQDIANRLGL